MPENGQNYFIFNTQHIIISDNTISKMDNLNNKKQEALQNLKGDFKLLFIALQRLSYDILQLIKTVRIPRWLWYAIGGAVFLFAIFMFVRSCDSDTEEVDTEVHEARPPYAFNRVPRVQRPEVKHRVRGASIKKYFSDLNDTHLSAARKIGIKPLSTREGVKDASRQLVELNDSDAYIVDNLTHSVPYLVPEAAALLKRIGENFQDSLVMKHIAPHKVIVSSVLRTYSDVKKLGRNNINSSKNSAHCYGTTIDITYKRFFSEYGEVLDKDGRLKNVLAEVLRDLKLQECCYIKHEKKQACFHITARCAPKE